MDIFRHSFIEGKYTAVFGYAVCVCSKALNYFSILANGTELFLIFFSYWGEWMFIIDGRVGPKRDRIRIACV
jgi:hypothetical protein